MSVNMDSYHNQSKNDEKYTYTAPLDVHTPPDL